MGKLVNNALSQLATKCKDWMHTTNLPTCQLANLQLVAGCTAHSPLLNCSTAQLLNCSTAQLLNCSTQLLNCSTQLLNSSTDCARPQQLTTLQQQPEGTQSKEQNTRTKEHKLTIRSLFNIVKVFSTRHSGREFGS